MDISFGTLIGQIIGLLLTGLIIYLVALIPISLKRMVTELTEIKEELRKRNGPGH